MASNNTSSSSQPHLSVFFIPWYATGHLLPMTDIAALFASRPGISSTILTTPANLPIIQPTITRNSSINTLLYPFPSAASSIPPGLENIATIPLSLLENSFFATFHARPAIERLVRLHRPHAIVSEFFFSWTWELGRDLNIPVILTNAVGLFTSVLVRIIYKQSLHLSASHETEPFLVPGLPHEVYIARSELPPHLRLQPEPTAFMRSYAETIAVAGAECFEFVVNSFDAIESEYVGLSYRSWLVGPLAVAAGHGGGSADNTNRCLSWLDGHLPESVVYVSFGSWCHFSREQIGELAAGLERCGRPFLWVVREESVGFLPRGFEERNEKAGMVVRGWAPQAAVLRHPAVGGFVMHCGWNAVMEGIAAGLPMVTWPLGSEQFINEKVVTEVLRVGVKCRGGVGSTVEEEKVVVRGEEVAAAVGRIMNKGKEDEEAAGMRRRAREYAEKAKEAVKEGGSSYNALTDLIEEIKAWHNRETTE